MGFSGAFRSIAAGFLAFGTVLVVPTSVRATPGKRVRFHVIVKINGALVKSTVQSFSAQSRK